jgi:hypothetical protein
MGYPLVVFIVSGLFCAIVLHQYMQRHKPYQLAWTVSLASASAGSLAYVIFLVAGRPELAFRLYYILGALLTAPLLGIGSLLLAAHSSQARARVRWVIVTVGVASFACAVLLLINPIHANLLSQLDGGPGTQPDVYASGPWEPLLIVLNIAGAVSVFGVAVQSGWRLYRRSGTGMMVTANVLIALGTYVISQAGGMARTGFGAGAFWLTMAVGWIVLFGGFLCTFSPRVEAAVARRSVARPGAITAWETSRAQRG